MKRLKRRAYEINEYGALRLIGSVVRQAIMDFCSTNKSKGWVECRQDAERFLFKDGVLESYFARYELQSKISCEYIRRLTLEIKKSYGKIDRKKLEDSFDLIEATKKDEDELSVNEKKEESLYDESTYIKEF